jgi:hypothetical protein
MTALETALVVLVALLVLGGSIWFGLRTANTTWQKQRREIATLNLALGGLAEATGLRLVGGGEIQHPIMGRLPGYASLHGSYRGHEVHLRVERRGGEVHEDVMLLEVMAGKGKLPAQLGSSEAEQALAERATVHVREDKLELVLRAPSPRSYHQLTWAFPNDPREIRRTLDAALVVAEQHGA